MLSGNIISFTIPKLENAYGKILSPSVTSIVFKVLGTSKIFPPKADNKLLDEEMLTLVRLLELAIIP